jgi:hypothetical protein
MEADALKNEIENLVSDLLENDANNPDKKSSKDASKRSRRVS